MSVLYKTIDYFFQAIEILILIRIIFSYLRIGPYSSIGRIVYELTEPVLAPARKIIYKIGIDTGMFDFSPVLTILVLRIISSIIKSSII